jgi:hypothetical protein
MMMSLRSKWTVGKAVRTGLALEGAYLNRYIRDGALDNCRSNRALLHAKMADWHGEQNGLVAPVRTESAGIKELNSTDK